MNSIEKYVSNIGYHFQSLTFDLTYLLRYFGNSAQKTDNFPFFRLSNITQTRKHLKNGFCIKLEHTQNKWENKTCI